MEWYGRRAGVKILDKINSKHTYMKPNMFKIMLIYINSLRLWLSENMHQCYLYCNRNWVFSLQGPIYHFQKLSPFIFVKSSFRCYMPIQREGLCSQILLIPIVYSKCARFTKSTQNKMDGTQWPQRASVICKIGKWANLQKNNWMD